MPPRRGRSSRSSGRFSGRRRPAWAELNQSVTLAAGAFSNLNVLADLDVAGSSILGVTTAFTSWSIQVTNWSAATDDIMFGFMLGRLSDVGVAAPAIALAANPGLSWAWHEELQPVSDGAAIRVTDIYRGQTKSKRRVRQINETYILAFLNQSATSKTLEVFVRALVALP
jgi:F420-0:gamma-glutamyl ligase-like protein